MKIIMYGDHGGELNRKICSEGDLKEVFKKMIDEVEIATGDAFLIED